MCNVEKILMVHGDMESPVDLTYRMRDACAMEQENHMISVIIPVYNLIDFLPKCLDSLLAQTYGELEILLIDDGSADGSAGLCDEYAARDERVRVRHQQNRGVSAARNAGMEMARGEYIGFVDGDDYLEPDMYERLLRNAEDYDADISACGMVHENGEGIVHETVGQAGKIDLYTGREARLQLNGLVTLLPSLCNKIYRRELLEYLINDTSSSYIEDMFANYRVYGKCRRVVVDGTVGYHYVQHQGSAVYSTVNQGHLDAIEKAEALALAERDDPELRRLWRRRANALRITVLNRIIKSGKFQERYKPIRRELLRNKTEIFKDSAYTRREKLQTLALWLCPGVYKFVVRKKSGN